MMMKVHPASELSLPKHLHLSVFPSESANCPLDSTACPCLSESPEPRRPPTWVWVIDGRFLNRTISVDFLHLDKKIISINQMLLKFVLLVSFTSSCVGIKICENGLFCVSDEDCQIGNSCMMDYVVGKPKSRCVPREDLDDSYYCSLSQKSCECE